MSNKKKKKPVHKISKQAAAEKEQLSSDSAIGWVCLLIAVFALIIMALVMSIRASNAGKAASSDVNESESIEAMPEDAEAFQAFEDENQEETGEIIYADIDVQDYGVITVRLDSAAAPITVANFVNLAESGFYDGLTFHRIIDGFMMQGGDPTGNGTGGSGTNIKGEFSLNGWDNPLSHTRGAISMARADDYDSASSQFFICQEDCSIDLDGKYACFGYVTEGMEIVDEICAGAQPIDENGSIIDSEQPVITSIVIRTA